MILHWKILFKSLDSSFHSNPNSCCFVFVHFQSHNAPNLPPLHISETGYGISKLLSKIDQRELEYPEKTDHCRLVCIFRWKVRYKMRGAPSVLTDM